MKTYKFIVINKNNMKDLKHFPTVEKVLDHILYGWVCNFIIIKDENKVLDFSSVGEDEDFLVRRSKIRNILRYG